MTEEIINKYIKAQESKLLAPNSFAKIKLNRKWLRENFCNTSGVYAVLEKNKLVYVGETSCINERLLDLLNTKHHTIRRHIGFKLFKIKATSKIGYDKENEMILNDYIVKNIKISTLPLLIGRKEVESYISNKHPNLYNRVQIRGKSSSLPSVLTTS